MIPFLAAALLIAAAPVDEASEQARQHTTAGNRAFDLGRYDEAIDEFQKAYLLKDAPALLYNVAQAYRLSSRPQEALRFYEKFLSKSPDAPNRVEVEKKIDSLTKVVAAQKQSLNDRPNEPIGAAPKPENPWQVRRPPAAPHEAVAATMAPSGFSKRDLSYVVGGVGVAALAGAGIFALKAKSAESQMNAAAAAHQPFDPSVDSTGRSSQTLSRVLLASGVAALGAGVTLFVLSRPVSVQAAPAGASAKVSF